MKRTELKRGSKSLKRTRFKRTMIRIPISLQRFQGRDGGERCVECVKTNHPEAHTWARNPDAHHICSRARAPGHEFLHDRRNRAWLCRVHHDAAHRGELPQYIKSRDFLDSLTKETP
jgi:hypothetical protein